MDTAVGHMAPGSLQAFGEGWAWDTAADTAYASWVIKSMDTAYEPYDSRAGYVLYSYEDRYHARTVTVFINMA